MTVRHAQYYPDTVKKHEHEKVFFICSCQNSQKIQKDTTSKTVEWNDTDFAPWEFVPMNSS